MKCDICKKKIEQNFLNKPFGTIIKDAKGKRRNVCTECQKQYKTKEAFLEKL